jgi:AraC-like DNA-binding protein
MSLAATRSPSIAGPSRIARSNRSATRSRDAVGVGPRSWRRLIRFERLTKRLAATLSPDWPALAQETGYYDQPHMIREFKEFAGLTPGEHLSRSLPDGGGLIEC